MQLAAIGCQKFFQDARYTRFRNPDANGMQSLGLRPDSAPSAMVDRVWGDSGPSRGQFA